MCTCEEGTTVALLNTGPKSTFLHVDGSFRILQLLLSIYILNSFYTLYTNSVRTSEETHYVSATKINWLMLFG
jgi:hypothetical protein